MIEFEMELVKYRDAGMRTYTYFWVRDKKTISPYFDSETDAYKWRDDVTQRLDKPTTDNL